MEKLNIDKIEISYKYEASTKEYLESKDFHEFHEFILIRNQVNSNYKYCFQIILKDSNEYFGNLYFGSYNLNRQLIYININNRILYINLDFNILYIIQECLNLEYNNISKLDIANDYDYNYINRFYKILKDEDFDIIILNKKYTIDEEIKSLLNISVGTRKNIHKFKSLYIQNREKGLVLNGYDKLKEIQDNEYEKRYIIENNKFKKSIYRLEVRTRHNLLKDTLNKLGFSDLYLYQSIIRKDISELKSIFDDLLNRLIRIQYKNKIYSLQYFL